MLKSNNLFENSEKEKVDVVLVQDETRIGRGDAKLAFMRYIEKENVKISKYINCC